MSELKQEVNYIVRNKQQLAVFIKGESQTGLSTELFENLTYFIKII